MARVQHAAVLLLVAVTAVITLAPQGIVAFNWAEPSGPKLTNNVVHTRTRWEPRWGAAVALIDNPPAHDEVVQSEAEKSRIFVMGGDDHKIFGGGGMVHNDVWKTTGANWRVIENLVDVTIWGDPYPRVVSKLNWEPVAPDRVPDEGVGYREWLCCIANWECETTVCDNVDLNEMRWSPRRHHGAAWIDKEIFVLGGRARALEDIAEDEAIGSIPWERGRQREISLLMSDVWSSRDGVSWTLVNPGCYVQQEDMLHKGAPVARVGRCRTDNDCISRRLGNAICKLGKCVCGHWGPRERFATVSYREQIYVLGGVTHVQKQLCGQRSCGFQYRAVLNDVWRSPNGAIWTPMTLNAAWPARGDHAVAVGAGQFWLVAGRGINSLVYGETELYNDVWTSVDGVSWRLNSTGGPFIPRCMHLLEFTDNKLTMFGGMMRLPDPPPPPKLTPAEQAAQAALNAPTEAQQTAEESVSSNVIEVTEAMDLDFQTVSGIRLAMLEESWSWDVVTGGAQWTLDFDNHTEAQYYLRPSSPLWKLQFVPKADRDALESHGIVDLTSLANADMETMLAAKEDVADACQMRATAQKIMSMCANVYVPYDGEDYTTIEIVEGDAQREDYESALAEAEAEPVFDDGYELEEVTGCSEEEFEGLTYVEEDVDIVCRWSPTARRNPASVVLNGFVYAIGGYRNVDKFANDVWYRDDHMPITLITTFPTHETSETLINFTSDESGTIYEYRFIDTEIDPEDGEDPIYRNWTIIKPPLDFLEWLPGSVWQFQVRAIDPAGNYDPVFEEGRNQWTWRYIPALPWGLIIGLTLLGLALIGAGYFEYRRRRRKKMMERYAIKKMRRKFKGMQKQAQDKDVDWRKYYDESKTGTKGKALAKEMAAELEKAQAAAAKKKKKKGKKDKKGKKGKQRGKGKAGDRKAQKKKKKKDKEKKKKGGGGGKKGGKKKGGKKKGDKKKGDKKKKGGKKGGKKKKKK